MSSKMVTFLLLFFVVSPAITLAQVRGAPDDRPAAERLRDRSIDDFRSAKGTIVSINTETGFLIVQEKNGTMHTATVTEETELKADEDTELAKLADEQELTFEHFKEGDKVKVVFRKKDRKAVELKLEES
jgi:hypothetical protein